MIKGKFFQIIGCICAIAVVISLYGCTPREEEDDRLQLAENLMESYPDSALIILDGMSDSELKSGKNKARHALLMSIALDKNCIDTTTFDVLQPAIDYYLKKGNIDERLKTYYYKGRIHDNAGDYDLAMESYIAATENHYGLTDSLTLARALVAQGMEYYRQYRIKDFMNNNLSAASVYERIGKTKQYLQCLRRALNGAIILSDESMADSIYATCQNLVTENPALKPFASKTFLMYSVQFGGEENIAQALAEIQTDGMKEDIYMNLARAYTKIGKPEIGFKYLNDAKVAPDDIRDSLTYWAVRTETLENLGRDGEALDAYRNYSRVLEIYHDQLFSSELLFSEKKHEMEIENMAKLRKRDEAIKWMLIGGIVLITVTALIYYSYRMNKAARLLAESNAEKFRLEGDNQRLRAENLESERGRLELEGENLKHKIGELEGEQTRLKELLDSQDTLSEEARELIRERIGMLNGLIAQALTEQESYGKEFKNYIKKIRKDKKGFQESLVKVLMTTHPAFIACLREHGLTDRELHYACLYAIGMRGKEIGTYLDLARHYNISTDIRRKLGLDPNDENLGPFLRNMMEGKVKINIEG